MEGIRVVATIGPLTLWDTEHPQESSWKARIRQKNWEQIEVALTSEGEDLLGKPAPQAAENQH